MTTDLIAVEGAIPGSYYCPQDGRDYRGAREVKMMRRRGERTFTCGFCGAVVTLPDAASMREDQG